MADNQQPNFDWDQIELRYVRGADDITLELLAGEYGCSPSTIRKKSAELSWTDKRKQFRADVRQRTLDQYAQQLADAHVDWDFHCFNAAKAMLSMLQKELVLMQQDQQMGGRVVAKEIDDTAKGLYRLQKIGKAALGDHQDTLPEDIDLEQLTDAQLRRIADGENVRDVLNG